MFTQTFVILSAAVLLSCSPKGDHPAVQAETSSPETTGQQTTMRTIKTVSIAEFQSLLEASEAVNVIDVRTPEEVAASGVIECAENIDFYDSGFNRRINSLDRNQPVFLYCAVGQRGQQAMQVFKDAGFQTVYNLEGGIRNWMNNGLTAAPCTE